MALNLFGQNALQPVHEMGWRSGLANLWRKESQHWWQNWYWQLLIWILLLDGFTAVAGIASRMPIASSPGRITPPSAILLMMTFFTIFSSFGTVIMAHGKLLDEQQSGTTAWILSKPVTRSAFLLAKFASLPGMLLTMTVIPGALAYLIFWLLQVQIPSLATFVLILLFNASSIAFFFCLMLLLGTLLKKRAAILGLGLFICFVLFQAIFQNSVITSILIDHGQVFLLMIGAFFAGALVCSTLMFARFAREEF